MARFAQVLGFFFAFRVAIPFLLFGNDPQNGLLVDGLLGGAFWAFSFQGRATAIEFSPVAKAIVAYLVWAAVTISWTPAPLGSSIGHWGVLVLDVWTIINCLKRSQDAGPDIFRGWITGALCLAVLLPFMPTDTEGRIDNEAVLNPHNLAPILSIAALLCLHNWRMHNKRVWGWFAAAFVMGIIFSGNKTDMVSVVAGGAIIVLFWRSERLIRRIWLASLAGLLIVVGIYFFGSYVVSYATDDTGSVKTLTGRVLVWEAAIEGIEKHPVIGNGFYASREMLYIPETNFDPGHAHNEWLQAWLTLGLPGLAFIILIYTAFLVQARRSSYFHRMLCYSLLIYGLCHSVAEAPFDLSVPMVLLVLLSDVRYRVPSTNSLLESHAARAGRAVAD
jgi:hypothetical protein